MPDYSNVDYYWAERGDLAPDNTGDIQDTSFNPVQSLIQEMRCRLECDKGDWYIYLQLGASLDDFRGYINNAETANEIKTRIANALCSDGFIVYSDLQIQIVPLTISSIMIVLTVDITGTPDAQTNQISIKYLWDLNENNFMFVTGG